MTMGVRHLQRARNRSYPQSAAIPNPFPFFFSKQNANCDVFILSTSIYKQQEVSLRFLSKSFEKEEARSFVVDYILKKVLVKEKSQLWRKDSLNNGMIKIAMNRFVEARPHRYRGRFEAKSFAPDNLSCRRN